MSSIYSRAPCRRRTRATLVDRWQVRLRRSSYLAIVVYVLIMGVVDICYGPLCGGTLGFLNLGQGRHFRARAKTNAIRYAKLISVAVGSRFHA